MNTIRLHFVDMYGNFDVNQSYFKILLEKKYNVIVDSKSPDFVICGPFGKEFLKYSCPRVFWTGEAIFPDFNVYDYAMGFERMQFGDRYLRLPLYAMYPGCFAQAKRKHLMKPDYFTNRKNFCDFIVSNPNGLREREEFFEKLNERKHVDSAGRYKNNMPNEEKCGNILDFRRDYRFSIVFENSIIDGYITEKIVQAWASGSIPIYLKRIGNNSNRIELDFNKEAYIELSDFSSMEKCIDYILELDSDRDKYLSIARKPIYIHNEPDFEQDILLFFERIIERGKEYLLRNGALSMWGRNYEESIKQSVSMRNNQGIIGRFIK